MEIDELIKAMEVYDLRITHNLGGEDRWLVVNSNWGYDVYSHKYHAKRTFQLYGGFSFRDAMSVLIYEKTP